MKATSSLIPSRYLSLITFLAFSFGFILTGQLSTHGNLLAAEKKAKSEPTTFRNTENFSTPCDSVWASTLQIFTVKGFIPNTTDRQAGVMNFTLGVLNTKDYTNTSYVKQYTKNPKAGFGNVWDGFRIDSAMVRMFFENDLCHCEIKFQFAGFTEGVTSGEFGRWHQLESNNRFESTMLSEIRSKLGSNVQNAPVPREQEPQSNKAVVQEKPSIPFPPQKAAEEGKSENNDEGSEIAYADCGNKLKAVPVNNSSSSGLKSLKCGQKVRVLGTEGAWTKIQTEAGKEGFVSSGFLATEKPKN